MATLSVSTVTFDRAYTPSVTVRFPFSFDAMAGRAVDIAREPIVRALMRLDGARPSEYSDYDQGLQLSANQSDVEPLRFTVRAV